MQKHITGKLLVGLLIVTNAVYLVMILWSLPRLVEYADGLKAFDMRPMGYTFSEAIKLLESLGPEGMDFYKTVQLRLDTLYPLGFMATYAVGCLWVFNKINFWKFFGVAGAIASVVAGTADYVENIYIYKMLSAYPELSEGLVFQAHLATVTKSIATTIAMILFMLGLLVLGFLSLKRGRKT